MSLFEWFMGMQVISMACGLISFVFTIVVGYYFVKGLERLKDE